MGQAKRAGHTANRAGQPSVVTSNPQTAPPALRCPDCDSLLTYVDTTYGGVQPAERWDRFTCLHCECGFEYRHRTRILKASD